MAGSCFCVTPQGGARAAEGIRCQPRIRDTEARWRKGREVRGAESCFCVTPGAICWARGNDGPSIDPGGNVERAARAPAADRDTEARSGRPEGARGGAAGDEGARVVPLCHGPAGGGEGLGRKPCRRPEEGAGVTQKHDARGSVVLLCHGRPPSRTSDASCLTRHAQKSAARRSRQLVCKQPQAAAFSVAGLTRTTRTPIS